MKKKLLAFILLGIVLIGAACAPAPSAVKEEQVIIQLERDDLAMMVVSADKVALLFKNHETKLFYYYRDDIRIQFDKNVGQPLVKSYSRGFNWWHVITFRDRDQMWEYWTPK